MSSEPITRGEFDSQLILVHQTIKNSNERNDIKHNALLERLDIVAEQNKDALELIKTGVIAHSKDIAELKEHKTITTVYWKIAISASTLAVIGVCGLIWRIVTAPLVGQ